MIDTKTRQDNLKLRSKFFNSEKVCGTGRSQSFPILWTSQPSWLGYGCRHFTHCHHWNLIIMILFLTFRYHQQHFGSRSSFACGSPFNELEDVRKPLRELSLILPDTREPSTPLLKMIMLVVVWIVVVDHLCTYPRSQGAFRLLVWNYLWPPSGRVHLGTTGGERTTRVWTSRRFPSWTARSLSHLRRPHFTHFHLQHHHHHHQHYLRHHLHHLRVDPHLGSVSVRVECVTLKVNRALLQRSSQL